MYTTIIGYLPNYQPLKYINNVVNARTDIQLSWQINHILERII